MEEHKKTILEEEELNHLIKMLEERNARLAEREHDLADKTEELLAQKEELTAAIEELMAKNQSLSSTMSQLQDRNFELDQILYRTSHDLRSPLSSIKGVLHVLKTEAQTATAKDCCLHIENKTEQMDNLLRSLSSLSKAILEEPSFSFVSVENLIHEVIESLCDLPAWNQVDVTYAIQENGIKTDAALLTIMVQSLLSNAYTFRDPQKKGTITIQTRREHDTFILNVMDDGEGIAPEVRKNIFEMFYRGSERSTGSGLGLYVARKAAERLNGKIEVSYPKDNTCFTVRIPILP